MYDPELVRSLLAQIREWLQTIKKRTDGISGAEDFVKTEEGRQKFDSICMLFIAAGEQLKRVDQLTNGELLSRYPEADWRGAMGFRDVIAHQYFQIDPEEVYGIIRDNLEDMLWALDKVIKKIE